MKTNTKGPRSVPQFLSENRRSFLCYEYVKKKLLLPRQSISYIFMIFMLLALTFLFVGGSNERQHYSSWSRPSPTKENFFLRQLSVQMLSDANSGSLHSRREFRRPEPPPCEEHSTVPCHYFPFNQKLLSESNVVPPEESVDLSLRQAVPLSVRGCDVVEWLCGTLLRRLLLV